MSPICIDKSYFNPLFISYLFMLMLGSALPILFVLWKIEQRFCTTLSRITTIQIEPQLKSNWKVRNLWGWKKELLELWLCIFWQIPFFMGSTVIAVCSTMLFLGIIILFTKPYTYLCYGF